MFKKVGIIFIICLLSSQSLYGEDLSINKLESKLNKIYQLWIDKISKPPYNLYSTCKPLCNCAEYKEMLSYGARAIPFFIKKAMELRMVV